MDFAVAEEEEEDGEVVSVVVERDPAICWINTSAWREMVNVDVCVIRKRVSMCLLILYNSGQRVNRVDGEERTQRRWH